MFFMGLKVLTLALLSLTGKTVHIHDTDERAKVIVKYVGGKLVYSLRFKDGRVEEVKWSADNQGFVSPKGEIEEDEAIEITTPSTLS
jgi:WD40 repeat protein